MSFCSSLFLTVSAGLPAPGFSPLSQQPFPGPRLLLHGVRIELPAGCSMQKENKEESEAGFSHGTAVHTNKTVPEPTDGRTELRTSKRNEKEREMCG